jgi:hypothetical protein
LIFDLFKAKKMTLKDKIEMQAQDTTQVYLHQEGIFPPLLVL